MGAYNMMPAPTAQQQTRRDFRVESAKPRCTPHLAAGVGVLAQLHVLPAHQPVQTDQHDVQALHPALRGSESEVTDPFGSCIHCSGLSTELAPCCRQSKGRAQALAPPCTCACQG